MKHVFVETNFLVGMARPLQEDRAARLAQRNGHDLILYAPWCAVTEARRKLADIIDDDLGFDQAMMKFAVRELGPTGDHAITRPSLAAEYARCGITYLSSFDVPT